MAMRKEDWAYQVLADWILKGELSQDQELDESILAAKLEVSRIPIRHALSRLTSEGLVIDRPHRKSVVAPMSLQDAEDVYGARAAIEVLLVVEASKKATASDIADIKEVLERHKQLVRNAEYTESVYWDRRFHFAMYEISEMRHSLSLFNRVRALSERYIHVYLSDPSRLNNSIEEHEGILDAFAKRKLDVLEELTREHIQAGIELLRNRSSKFNQ